MHTALIAGRERTPSAETRLTKLPGGKVLSTKVHRPSLKLVFIAPF